MSEASIGVTIVDIIPAHIEGAPAKIVALAEDGRFFIGRREEGGALKEVTPPVDLLPVARMARAIVSGDPRATTAPGGQLGLATALLVALHQCSELQDFIERQFELALAAASPEPAEG